MAAWLAISLLAVAAAACDADLSPDGSTGTNGGTRPSAASGGGEVLPGGDLDTLLGQLRDGTRTERAYAAESLGALGDPAAVPALVDALADESWEVRASVAGALALLPDERAVDGLLALIAVEPGPPDVATDEVDSAVFAGNAAIGALAAVGDVRAAARLAEIAIDPGTALDTEAAAAAVVSIGADAVPAVVALVDSATASSAPAAVTLLGQLGDPALDPLVGLLDDRRPGVRVAAAEALGSFGSAAVGPLIEATGGPGDALRIAAARALGRTGSDRATAPLVGLLDDSAIRRAAVSGLVALHRDDATPLLRYLRKSSTVQVYRPIIRIGQDDTVGELIDALDRFGTKTMGEVYLNCGEPRLEKAAKRWASAHGYVVIPSVGAGEEAWGVP